MGIFHSFIVCLPEGKCKHVPNFLSTRSSQFRTGSCNGTIAVTWCHDSLLRPNSFVPVWTWPMGGSCSPLRSAKFCMHVGLFCLIQLETKPSCSWKRKTLAPNLLFATFNHPMLGHEPMRVLPPPMPWGDRGGESSLFFLDGPRGMNMCMKNPNGEGDEDEFDTCFAKLKRCGFATNSEGIPKPENLENYVCGEFEKWVVAKLES